MTRITLDQVLSWKPCPAYTKERIQALAPSRKSLTPLEACDLPIPPEDMLWLLVRPEIFTDYELRILAADFAEAVLPIFEEKFPTDQRPRLAIQATREYAAGQIGLEQLQAARAAAWSAADTAARAARDAALSARDAAWATADTAARAAARDAARAAARDAAETAARDAAWAARAAAWAAAETAAWAAQLDLVRTALMARGSDRQQA